MRRHWQLFRMALRAVVWRKTAEPPVIGPRGLAAWTVVSVAALALLQYPTPGSIFSEYGLGLLIGSLLLSMAVTALVLPVEDRVTALSGTLVASLIIACLTVAVLAVVSILLAWADAQPSNPLVSYAATVAVDGIWLIGAYAAVLRSVDPEPRYRPWRRAAALWAVQAAVMVAFPNYPVFISRTTHDTPNVWAYAREFLKRNDAEREDEPKRVDGSRVELAQPALMERAIERLAPQVAGETDVYAIGIAGWAEQDVFVKELDGGLAAIEKVLPVRQRTIRLINHADTVWREPAAMLGNFAAAVRAVGRAMNKDEDVLLLFMTSHGSPDGFALRLPGLMSGGLSPGEVADVLDSEGIKNRIVIVSACYSGVFIKPLADDNTIVLTAADEKSTSFGCSNEREWTYFGDALFNHGLRPDVNLEEAFRSAQATIGQWEARDGLTPSHPQGHFGPALMAKLARIYGGSRQADERTVSPRH